jgi:L-ascorbate metabolism protein UlaG (beta-lactamase superfamily)
MKRTNGFSNHQNKTVHLSLDTNLQLITGYNGATLTFVGHATTCIQLDGEVFVTDPLLRDRLWHLRRETPCTADDCLPLEIPSAVLLSHLHLDHVDIPSLKRIPDHVPLIAPEGTGGYLRTRLSHPVHTLGPGESYRVGSVEVIAVPAAHSGPGPSLSPLSACAGFVVRGSATVYFAGDTALFQEMEELGSSYALDLALLPVWGYGPNLRGDHMTPRDAAQALTMLRPRRAIPIHWGTFRPLGSLWSRLNYFNDPPYTFAGYAGYVAPDTMVHVLQPGESLQF